VREARASCAEAKKRADALEGELATCQGRLAGLGEGCSKCWHMLDESRVGASHALHEEACGVAAWPDCCNWHA
jgi:hypothetical protein